MEKLCLLVFILICFAGHSQVEGLRYDGVLIDAVVEHPIAGAVVTLTSSSLKMETLTDEKGKFSFSKLAAGYYHLSFQSLGYESLQVVEVEVNSGLPKSKIFSLVPSENELESVVVQAPSRNRAMQSFNSIHTLTVEESFRFPGTFYDPARLATHYAGVINDNDQANNLVIRGNSPNLMGWYLEDVEIVNPNHTSNAGTINDQSTQSGGGVNILSAQMIDNSVFLKSAFPATYGNAISGVMDMHLRDGAKDQLHFTGQIGLIGIDAALEGPLGKQKNASFLINYRYSTLGLLSSIGVDLGDEQINFQDISFHVKLPIGKNSIFSIFGMGGMSENIFEGTSDQDLWVDFKDRQNITFKSKMGTLGLSLQKNQWKTTLAFSGNSHKRFSAIIISEGLVNSFERDINEEGRISLHSRKRFSINSSAFLDLGVRLNQISYNNLSAQDFVGIRSTATVDTWLLQAYASSRWKLSPKQTLKGGVHFSNFTLNGSTAIEPRIALNHKFSTKSNLSLSYGTYSRLPSQNALFIKDPIGNTNENLGFLRSHHLVLGFNKQLTSVSRLTAELYYQHLFDLPIGEGENRSFSTINSIANNGIQSLVSEGVGDNYGFELSFQQYFDNGTYYQLNGSLFDSKYTGADGIRRNTRYNARFASNLTGGKEFSWHKNNKVKSLGISIRAYARGGFWEGPINSSSSQVLLTTIYDESLAFTEQLPSFFKIDFRLHYKRTKEKYTSILGLDILNATNQQNIAYYYWNPTNQSTLAKNHLGLIPILSYRIEF